MKTHFSFTTGATGLVHRPPFASNDWVRLSVLAGTCPEMVSTIRSLLLSSMAMHLPLGTPRRLKISLPFSLIDRLVFEAVEFFLNQIVI